MYKRCGNFLTRGHDVTLFVKEGDGNNHIHETVHTERDADEDAI